MSERAAHAEGSRPSAAAGAETGRRPKTDTARGMTHPDLLFLTQRLPYPPNKGEKIRHFQLLKACAQRHRVHLGTLIDDPADWRHVPDLGPYCADARVGALAPRRARLACQRGWLSGRPLSFTYFASADLRRWVHDVLERVRPAAIVVCSTNMAPYVLAHPFRPEVLIVDYGDLDSAKWDAYAGRKAPPMRWVYGREARLVRRAERRIAARADWCSFTTDIETESFRAVAPEHAGKARTVGNGVDARYFSPDHRFAPPFDPARPHFVFTGTMNYWPNVDAVTWFAREILPQIRRRLPDARFVVAGANPDAAVTRLADGDGVVVTGRVPDVRPYLAHAVAAVAPLRVARGIQNKVLEAMAMGRPVVTTQAGLTGIDAQPGRDLCQADSEADFARACIAVAEDPAYGTALGSAARRRIRATYSWAAQLAGFAAMLPAGADDSRIDPAPTAALSG